MENEAAFPKKLQFLFKPKRYKVAYGGRGGAKSWGVSRALLILGAERKLLILCTRETQRSIADSVHKLLADQILNLNLGSFYRVQQATIRGANGTEFIFSGLHQNIGNLKSYEAVDICWVEEAQTVSKKSWDILIPTIRKNGSEIWATFNPELETDDTYRRFVTSPPPDAEVIRIGWQDNPWFPEVLRKEMEHLRAQSEDDYQHVYEGACRQVVEGAIYRAELIAADKAGRITRVPYDPTQPVHTFWDIGFGDNTCIWFAQSIGFEFRLIDFLSDCLKDVTFYLKALQERGYLYGTHYLPHDARAKQFSAAGRTVQQQIAAGGRAVAIVPNLSIVDGLASARAVFSRCWFDAEKCADGLQALRHYRYEVDDSLGTFKQKPLHDWASHPADAFRTFAVAIQEPKRKREEYASRIPETADAWMA